MINASLTIPFQSVPVSPFTSLFILECPKLRPWISFLYSLPWWFYQSSGFKWVTSSLWFPNLCLYPRILPLGCLRNILLNITRIELKNFPSKPYLQVSSSQLMPISLASSLTISDPLSNPLGNCWSYLQKQVFFCCCSLNFPNIYHNCYKVN